jgi:D-aspartate ligase
MSHSSLSQSNPVFILGMGANGLGAARALGKHGVPIIGLDTDRNAPGLRSKYLNSCVSTSVETSAAQMVDLLLDEAAKQRTRCVLMPTSDSYLELICDYWESLSEAFIMPLAGVGTIRGLVNKRSQYEKAVATGIPIPRTYFPDSPEGLVSLSDELSYPVIVKPYHSSAWQKTRKIKGFKAERKSELIELYSTLDPGEQVLLQEYVPGLDNEIISVAGYVFGDGSVSRLIAWRKERQFPIDAGVGCFVRTVEDQEAIGFAERTVKSFGIIGIFEIELKRDARDGQYKMIEINARSWLQNALAEKAGLNLILISYLDALGMKSDDRNTVSPGVRWWDAYSDTLAFWELRKKGDLTLGQWARSIMGCESYGFLSLYDPLPVLVKWRWGTAIPGVLFQAMRGEG